MRRLLLLVLCSVPLVAAEQPRLTFNTAARKVVSLKRLMCNGEWNKCAAQLSALEPDDLDYMQRCCMDHEGATDVVNDLRLPTIKAYFDQLKQHTTEAIQSVEPQYDQWIQEEDENSKKLFQNVPLIAPQDQLVTDAVGNVTGHFYGVPFDKSTPVIQDAADAFRYGLGFVPLQQSLVQVPQTASEKSEVNVDYERALEIFSLRGTTRWQHVEALQTTLETTLSGDKDAIKTYLVLEKIAAQNMAAQITQLRKDWVVNWIDTRSYTYKKRGERQEDVNQPSACMPTKKMRLAALKTNNCCDGVLE